MRVMLVTEGSGVVCMEGLLVGGWYEVGSVCYKCGPASWRYYAVHCPSSPFSIIQPFFFSFSFSSHNSAIIVSCLPSSYEKGLFTILPHRVTFAFFSSEQEAEGVLTFQFRDTSTIFIKAS